MFKLKSIVEGSGDSINSTSVPTPQLANLLPLTAELFANSELLTAQHFESPKDDFEHMKLP